MTRKKKVEIYDTTLRDGAQTSGICFSVRDKLKITQKLDDFGVDFIEGGWPGAIDEDTEFFKKVGSLQLEKAVIVAFGMTCKKGKDPEEDKGLKLLLESEAEIIALVGKSSESQVKKVLSATPEENLRMIEESCAFLKSKGRRVIFDAEHFFDGFKNNYRYALKTLKAAFKGGAEKVILCDTKGGTLPWEIARIVRRARMKKLPLGIHAHNDAGLALANSLAAVENGAIQVQATINGYGERCGNADLCALIPTLQLKMGFDCVSSEQLASLSELSRFAADIANLVSNPYQPYTGNCAFIHKGGIHGHAQAKDENSYQHIDPALVGSISSVAVSKQSGRANIKAKAKKFGIDLSDSQVEAVSEQVKELESQGLHFEAAEASLELLMLRNLDGYSRPFEILVHRSATEYRKGRNPKNEAVVKIKIGVKGSFHIAEGNGPVHALDKAIRKALPPPWRRLIKETRLCPENFKVRTIEDGKKGTGSKVRTLIEFTDGKKNWTTVWASTSLVEASCQALADGLEYALSKKLAEERESEKKQEKLPKK